MNKIIQEYYPMFEQYQIMRNQLMEILDDADLSFRPSEKNPSLGALCLGIGEIQVAYTQSFQTFQKDFSYRHGEANVMKTSVPRLEAWFGELDAELKQAVSTLSDEDINTRSIETAGFTFTIEFHLMVYAEALIIFYGKVSVYLKAMDKELPKQWQDWIG